MSIFERGYNRWLIRGEHEENLESRNVFEEGVSPNILLSGGLSGNLEMVDGHIQSSNFVENDSGWQIKYDGTAQFSDIALIGGQLKYQKTSFTDNTKSGYYIGSEGIYMGAALDATKLKFTIADGSLDLVGTVSGRSTATLADSINSDGNLVKEVINEKLDTSAKNILDSFTFGASGAIQIGTYEAGVTGDIKISPSGIVGRNKSNENTFTLDATTGDATFAGTLSAAAGTLGVITAGTLRGTTLSIGTGNDILKVTTDGIQLGHDTFASAPFSVNMKGHTEVKSLMRKDFHLFTAFESGDGYGTWSDGDGLFTFNEGRVKSLTGTTSGNYNEMYKILYTNYSNAFNWDKKRTCRWSMGFQSGGNSNCDIRLVTGSMQNLTRRHIGFRILNGTIYASVADGTTQTTVSLGTMSSNNFQIMEFRLTPGVGVDFYLDGDYFTTITTNLPTGTNGAEWLLDWHVITNENAAKEVWLSWMDIWQEM